MTKRQQIAQVKREIKELNTVINNGCYGRRDLIELSQLEKQLFNLTNPDRVKEAMEEIKRADFTYGGRV